MAKKIDELHEHEEYNQKAVDANREKADLLIGLLNNMLDGAKSSPLNKKVGKEEATFTVINDEDTEEEVDYFLSTDELPELPRIEEIECDNPFSGHALDRSLRSNFPWCVGKAKNETVTDLLYVGVDLDMELQLSVMKLVFVTVDLMGKMGGQTGGMAPFNIVQIDQIIESISQINNQILTKLIPSNTQENSDRFKEKINDVVDSYIASNENIHDGLVKELAEVKTYFELAPILNKALHRYERNLYSIASPNEANSILTPQHD